MDLKWTFEYVTAAHVVILNMNESPRSGLRCTSLCHKAGMPALPYELHLNRMETWFTRRLFFALWVIDVMLQHKFEIDHIDGSRRQGYQIV
jgi:hypothetical protein